MTKFSVRKPMTVLVAVVMVFALGLASFRGMTPELLPNIELPYVITMTTYPGASPEKVEEEVTRPLEEGFATLEGLDSIQSQSSENVSLLIMEFTDSADLDAVSLEIVQKVNQIEGGWDDMVSTPVILKMNPDMLPVMIAAVEQEGFDTTEVSRLMEESLQTKLEGIEGVASLDVTGLRAERVNVVLKQEKIGELNARVGDAIKGSFVEKEQELRDTQTDLEGKLDEVKAQTAELDAGAKEFAVKMGEGSTELASSWAALFGGLQDQKTMLADLKEQLQTLTTEEEAARAAAPGGALPEPVEKQFKDAKDQMGAGITKLEDGIESVQEMQGTLSDAQGTLNETMSTTLFGLSNAAAQLAGAQSQLSVALTQIEQGLTQLDTARDSAVEQADMGGALTMDTVLGILKAQNFSMPAGYVQEGSDDYLVQVGDEIASLEEMQQLVLLDPGIEGIEPIRLSEVADLFMSDNLNDLYAKINGHDGILLSFNKQSEYATTEVADNILQKFDELSDSNPGLHFTPLLNQGDYIYMVINGITSDLLWGALFAVVILLLFLRDLRPTFVTLCAIPISVVFALVAMYFSGVTINIISLSGLAIAVGRLVDDSVVVIENIFRLRSKGYSPVKAAVNGAGQVAGAIIASTLTTICVFLPIVFVQGLTRQLFTDFALTFAYALLASLLVALTLVPTMASGLFRKMEPKEHRLLDRAIALYDRALVWTLRFKPVVLVFAAVLLAASVAVVWSRGFAYMPDGNSGQIAINLTIPKEVPDEQKREVADDAAARVAAVDGVETVGAMAGGSGIVGVGALSGMGGGSGQGSALGSVTIYALLDQGKDMDRLSDEIEAGLEGVGAEYEVGSASMMDASALGGSGVTVNLYGDSLEDMVRASEAVRAQTEGLAGIAEFEGGAEEATPVLHYTVDREAAAKHGLTTAQVYQQVSSALSKEKNATDVLWGTEGYDVVVMNGDAADDRLTPSYLEALEFNVTKRDGSTEKVRLADVATVTESKTLQSIQRSEQRRMLPVNLTITPDANITLVTQEVERSLVDLELPEGVTYEVTGENTTIMDSFRELGIMLVLGLLLVYLIMVAQFQSLKSPFIIMFTVPLAFTGGFLALLVTDKVLSVISLIGFAMLIGVIVSNAIVLVDYINRLRHEGMERVAAIREGAAVRMRPILMTALTTIFALLMMALGIGSGSEMMQPLAIVCIGGLAYGTLMTLFVIPVIYDLLNKKDLRTIDEDDLATVTD
ncbi:MAG: efflux RND transporter permease subunit [Coriobacteriales bacterium]|jgi:HAE1 family hydrophobic/amphiphilic exporter-1|nr:efflux RND transporter permease subunit [Coriobacteriales bacterium]